MSTVHKSKQGIRSLCSDAGAADQNAEGRKKFVDLVNGDNRMSSIRARPGQQRNFVWSCRLKAKLEHPYIPSMLQRDKS